MNEKKIEAEGHEHHHDHHHEEKGSDKHEEAQ